MRQSKWIPGKDITRHSGNPIPNDLDFFIPPPLEIGKVISADSTLTLFGHSPKKRCQTLILSLDTIGCNKGNSSEFRDLT